MQHEKGIIDRAKETFPATLGLFKQDYFGNQGKRTQGKKDGGWSGLMPPYRSERTPSLTLYDNGRFYDFGDTDDPDFDVFDFLAKIGEAKDEASAARLFLNKYANGYMESATPAYNYVKTSNTAPTPLAANKQKSDRSTMRQIIPAPDTFPDLYEKKDTLNGVSVIYKITAWHIYRTEAGDIWGLVSRQEAFDVNGNIIPKSKIIRPWIFVENEQGQCRWESAKLDQFPLYYLDLLAKYPKANVLIVSGEKCADAANKYFEKYGYNWIAITWQGGDNQADKTDFTVLKNRQGRIAGWPDKDTGGIKCMKAVMGNIPRGVTLNPPKDKFKGWDIADAIAEGWDYDDIFEFIELDYQTPDDWLISRKEGIQKVIRELNKQTKEWDTYHREACQNMVVISAQYKNIEDKKERIELTLHKEGWKKTVHPRSTVFDRYKLMSIADCGLLIARGTTSTFENYLMDFQRCNKIPIKESISHFAWIQRPGERIIPGKTRFFPYCENVEYDINETEDRSLYEAIKSQGTLDEWKNRMDKYSHSFGLRTMLAASFASPLLPIIVQRSFVIHFWEESGYGKTAVSWGAQSVWARPGPKGLEIPMNSSWPAMESMCNELKNLTLFLDEKQSVDEDQVSFKTLIYRITEGATRAKSTSHGARQKRGDWNLIVVSTGETPLIKTASQQGEQNRVIEIKHRPLSGPDEAVEVYEAFKDQYGTAGPVYISRLGERDIPADNKRFKSDLKEYSDDNYQVGLIAVLCTGDMYRQIYIWDEDPEAAYESAKQFGINLLTLIGENKKDTLITRAKNEIRDWLSEYNNYFIKETTTVDKEGEEITTVVTPESGKVYGLIEHNDVKKSTKYYVINSILKNALSERDFDEDQIIAGFIKEGYLTLNTKTGLKGTPGFQVKRKGNNMYCYLIEVYHDNIPF